MSNQTDEADKHKAGKLSSDPKDNVRPIALQVPRVMTVYDLLKSSYERLIDPERDRVNCTTGCHELDLITGGFRPGFTWLFGATTSWGKSSWLVSVADVNIRKGRKVLVVSSEDTDEVYGDRFMVRRADVDAIRFRTGKRDLSRDDHRRIADALAEAKKKNSPVFVDARRYPVEDLAGHLRKIIAEHQIELVAFDYVQEFSSKRKFQDERVKFREIASVLRHITKDAKVAGIIFSQLTTDEKTKVPTRLNIRDCRDMANAAEVIILGFEPEQAIMNGDLTVAKKGQKCIYVDKVKNGPRNRIVALNWDADKATFKEQKGPEEVRLEQLIGNEFDDYDGFVDL